MFRLKVLDFELTTGKFLLMFCAQKKIHKQGIPAGLWTGEVCLSLLGGVCAASYWASLLHLQPTTDRPKMCHLPHPLSDNVAASLQNTTSNANTNTNDLQIEIQNTTA